MYGIILLNCYPVYLIFLFCFIYIMDKEIVEKILDCDKKHSLEYKWYCRKLDISSVNDSRLREIFNGIKISSFNYYNDNINAIINNKSLSIVCKICNCGDTALTTKCTDYSIKDLGKHFNKIANSGRGVLMCYDCGSTARAIFLNLIYEYRGVLTEIEKKRIRTLYNPERLLPIDALNEFYSVIKVIKEHCVFILSIGMDDFGHVLVMEKTIDDAGKERYIIYQSALNSYLTMDYIEYKNLALEKSGIKIEEFYRDMNYLIKTFNWTEKENVLFSKWFQFLPTSNVTNVKSVLYAWVSLDKRD